MEQLTFGVFDHVDKNDLPLADFYEARLKIAEAYDREGFFAYHCAEHHLTPGGMAPSPSVYLSAIAQRTTRLRFGPMIYTLPLYHPVRIAEEICMLDQLSRGRLEMGFGRGSNPIEISRYFGSSAENAEAVYRETLATLMDVLSKRTIRFQVGEEMRDIPLPIEPYQTPYPPIWYGVHSVESTERAARIGSHVMSLDTALETRAYAERYREVWAERPGPAEPMPKIGLGRFVFVADTDEEALRLARPAYARWHRNFMHTSRLHGYKISLTRPDNYDEMHTLGRAIAGSPQTVAAFVDQELALSKANYFVGQFAYGDLPLDATLHSIELFARQVRPMLGAAMERLKPRAVQAA